MPDPKYAAYEAANPYFELVRGALGDLVDGEHFFESSLTTLFYEVLYDVAGWPGIKTVSTKKPRRPPGPRI